MRLVLAAAALLAACRLEPEPVPTPTPPLDAPPDAPPPAPPAPVSPAAPRPFTTPEIRAARELAQRRVLGETAELLPDLPPAGAPAFGRFSPLVVPPDADPLAGFHAALTRLRAGDPAQPRLRVLVYGASGTAAEFWTAYLRAYLQARFGDGGPGFVSPVRHRKWSRHAEYVIDSSAHWQRRQPGPRTAAADGRYGLAGVAMVTDRAGETGALAPSPRAASSLGVAALELLYLAQPGGGRVSLQIDDAPAETLATAAAVAGPGARRFELEPGPHRLRLRTLDRRREVRVFGVVAERRDRGVVVDTLGIDGAGVGVHLGNDEALWAEHVRRRDPALVLLAYGTNEAFDADFAPARFAADYRAVLARLRRAAPAASCVLLAPGDHGRRDPEADPAPERHLAEVRRLERELAAEAGCALWDALDVMGGPGAMAAWVAADPPLARPDHVHTTARGAVLTAMALADALLLHHDLATATVDPAPRVEF